MEQEKLEQYLSQLDDLQEIVRQATQDKILGVLMGDDLNACKEMIGELLATSLQHMPETTGWIALLRFKAGQLQ